MYRVSHDVFRIIDVETGKAEGVYSRAYHDEYDFSSVESARRSNVHGIYKDKFKYKISKYRVTYELIEDSVDNPTKDDIKEKAKADSIEKEMDEMGIPKDDIVQRIATKVILESCRDKE